MHSLVSLMSNCWNLPSGVQGKSRRPKIDSYKQDEEREDRNGLYLGGSCSVSIDNSTIFF